MNNKLLLPRLAWNGIRNNKSAYFPFMLTYIFSAAVFFIMLSIVNNPLMKNVPHAEYMRILMVIGCVLLGLILTPFLISANGFLIKRRKRELGLYSILGLEKRHIGVILFIEAAVIYIVSVTCGILLAVLFSKLIFLFLTRVTGLPVEAAFLMDRASLKGTLSYFGALSAVNLVISLFRVSLSNPAELFKESRKGEKEMRHLFPVSLLGLFILGGGYFIALKSKMNMFIFTDFFFSVALVVVGTYILFTAGSVAFLKLMKKRDAYYYRPQNFVTVSGMLYRMKKSAADLSNICIYSTMVMITLICTVALFRDEEGAVRFLYHYDNSARFYAELFPEEKRRELAEVVEEAAAETGVVVRDSSSMEVQVVGTAENGNRFERKSEENSALETQYLYLISLDDFNRVEKSAEKLGDGEVLVYSCAKDFGYPWLQLEDDVYRVKKEFRKVSFEPKEERAYTRDKIYVVFRDKEAIERYADAFSAAGPGGGEDQTAPDENRRYLFNYNMEGEEENQDALTARVLAWCSAQQGFMRLEDINEGRRQIRSMYGGLLFLGVFFGITFSVCLVLIIYYKQLSEGYEDQDAFSIMKKVGMDGREIRSTIRRQIQTVFFLPFLAAVLHSFVGLKIVSNLMCSINVYNQGIIVSSALWVMAAFAVFYGISYLATARAYYRIVN